MDIERSRELLKEAMYYIPGGVNSPVRAFKSVGGDPVFIERGLGSKIFDADGNEFIDYIGSWGPHLFGHNPEFIVSALEDALNQGTSFGAPTELEVDMARLVCELVPSIELVRMVNSGSEATMSAVRLARGHTERDKVIKFEGCYHGHGDSFLIQAGSGALTFGSPTSPGVTKNIAADTLVAKFNDLGSVKEIVKENKNNVAAIILEPIAGNMGVIRSDKDFLQGLRDLCDEEGITLIFDEVMTGFRVAKGGAQEIYGIQPDLTTFGKVIGGGLPVGAFGGKKEIMEKISPTGPIYQAGTLSGNPLAMAAGVAALQFIKDNPIIYEQLEEKGAFLEKGLREAVNKAGRNYTINRAGSMLCMFFTDKPVNSFSGAVSSDTGLYARYFHGMLERGIHLTPSQFESIFVSLAHSMEDLEKTVAASAETLEKIF